MLNIGCNNNEETPSPNTPSTSNMTTLEQSLVGDWKLKRIELNNVGFYQQYQDSMVGYTHYYNYTNSKFNFTSTSTTINASNGHQQYNVKHGTCDNTNWVEKNWYAEDNQIFLENGISFNIIYLTSDSLVMDCLGLYRYYLNKNTIPPSLNNIEAMLIGRWKAVGTNCTIYKTFKSVFNNPCLSVDYTGGTVGGYTVNDSIVFSAGITYEFSTTYEVLHPELSIPTYYGSGGLMTGNAIEYSSDNLFYKLTNISATSFTIVLRTNFSNSYSPLTFIKL